MTLFNLAIKNIRRNLKSYTLYLGSIIFTIAIYFTFVTLQHSGDIMEAAGAMTKIDSLMNMSSILLLIFAAIFISYSNTFFLKKRKKEVGLYLLLGIRKRKVGWLLFFENLVIGIIALILGIVIGFIISQGMLAILIRLMGFNNIGGLPLSIQAVKNTGLVFLILFLFTSYQGYRVINKFSLIELFHAVKKGEKLPKPSIITTSIGIALLVIAYYFASVNPLDSWAWRMFSLAMPIIILLSTVIGTYLLFHSVLVFVFSMLKKNKRWAWRGLNMMTVSQMLYRIRSNAKTLTVIAVLSATTITSGGAIFGLYYNVAKDTESSTPNTFMWEGENINVQSDVVEMKTEVHVKNKQIEQSNYTYEYSILAETEYNKLAQYHNKKVVSLAEDEAYIIDPYLEVRLAANQNQHMQTIIVDGITLAVNKSSTENVLNNQLVYLTAVVSDEVYEQLSGEVTTYQLINTKDEADQLALSQSIQDQLGEKMLSSYPKMYHESLQSIGVLLFVGSFLGLVFLVATGSIIYFKMMTEAEEDKDKYEGLYKIGVSYKEIKKTIRAQVAIIFVVPLVLGILHASFALKTFSNLFFMDIMKPVIIWMVLYSCVYAIYYVLTVKYFNGTVKGKLDKVGVS